MIPISCDSLSQRDRRSLVFHLLYAADAFDYEISTEALVEKFAHGYDCIIDRNDQVFHVAQEVIENRDALDQQIFPLLENWKFDRLSVATRLILRYAVWELTKTDTPSVVVINEAVELAQCFAEKDAYRFVNGILDEWRKRNRPEEIIEAPAE
jgi:N utilization substance protein B